MLKAQRLEDPLQGQLRPDSQQGRLEAISPPNPLAITELIELIGYCLNRHSLAMCLRVCHQWYRVLHRHL